MGNGHLGHAVLMCAWWQKLCCLWDVLDEKKWENIGAIFIYEIQINTDYHCCIISNGNQHIFCFSGQNTVFCSLPLITRQLFSRLCFPASHPAWGRWSSRGTNLVRFTLTLFSFVFLLRLLNTCKKKKSVPSRQIFKTFSSIGRWLELFHNFGQSL